ncbi:MAG TPA: phage tail protein [Chitinophagaceae bacterium]|jgi:phage tail-like protein
MSTYPLPVFHYKVTWNNVEVGFSDVSGLTQEIQVIEYRDGGTKPSQGSAKMPGFKKYSNITLKRGIVAKDSAFYDWFNNGGSPGVERRDLVISLLNDGGDPVMTWTVLAAWPIKVEGPGLKATGNEIAIESIELVHESLSVKAN